MGSTNSPSLSGSFDSSGGSTTVGNDGDCKIRFTFAGDYFDVDVELVPSSQL
jgi:hypothetical protein